MLTLIAGILLLLMPQGAQACAACAAGHICPLPGYALIGGYVSLVLAILGGLIERPFCTLAGVRRRALAYSIQANLLSTIVVGILGDSVLASTWRTSFGWSWPWFATAVVLASFLEFLWLAKPWREPMRRLRWWWLLVGNVISAIVLGSLPTITALSGLYGYSHYYRIYRLREPVADATFMVCIIVCIVAFASTRGGANKEREEPQEADSSTGQGAA